MEEFQKFVDECYKEESDEQQTPESQLNAKRRELHESSEEEVEETSAKKRQLHRPEEEEVSAKAPRLEEDFSDESEEEAAKPRPRRVVVSDSDDS